MPILLSIFGATGLHQAFPWMTELLAAITKHAKKRLVKMS
jgi:hypothetical protein